MSAEIKRLFPEGLRNNEAERSKPRHDPPLCFVPVKSLAKEDGVDEDDKSITVELCDKTTLKVVPYSFVDVESFLNYQKKHAYILDQQELKTKWRKLDALTGLRVWGHIWRHFSTSFAVSYITSPLDQLRYSTLEL